MVITREGTRLYFSRHDGQIFVVDLATLTTTMGARVSGLTALAVSPDGSRLHGGVVVSHPLIPVSGASLVSIDLATNTVVGNTPLTLHGGFAAVAAGPSPAAPTPSVGVTVSAANARPGGRVDVGVLVGTDPAHPTVDLYVGILLPDGQTIAFLSASGEVSSLAGLAGPSRFVPARRFAPGTGLETPTFARLIVPPGLPPGRYTVFAALAPPGAFADDWIDPGDVFAIYFRVVTVLP